MLIVQLCDFGNDGDSEYRIHEPARQLGALPGVTALDCQYTYPLALDLAREADVLVVHNNGDWDLLDICHRRRAAGKITVFEANDDLFDLHPWNPLAEHWANREVQDLYERLLRTADAVQASSEPLAGIWRRRGARNVKAFTNHLPQIELLPERPADRPFTIGWSGSPGHFADLLAVTPVLQRWLDQRPDVHLAIMTSRPADEFFRLDPARFRFAEFGSLSRYLRFLRNRLDVGIAPLLPTSYNRCRSDVKLLEYASNGVVGIYSDLDPYQESVPESGAGLLAHSPEEFGERLTQLYEDRELLAKCRRDGYTWVANHRMAPARIGERLAWYQELLDSVPDRPTTVDAGARQALGSLLEPGYRELRIADTNAAGLAEVSALGTELEPASALVAVEAVLEEAPRFAAAWNAAGKLACDAGKPQQAIELLTHSLQLAPDQPRAWTELGRARYLLDDNSGAREAFESALDLCPDYLPAWQYLIRMLEILQSPDRSEIGLRAIKIFGTSYPTAISAITLLDPADRPVALRELVLRVQPTLTQLDMPVAQRAFVDAATAIVAGVPTGLPTIEMLRSCCHVFPQSAALHGLLGDVLFRLRRDDAEAQQLWARAASLAMPQQVPGAPDGGVSDARQLPWTWQLGAMIARNPMGSG